jgi:hypothetical protein
MSNFSKSVSHVRKVIGDGEKVVMSKCQPVVFNWRCYQCEKYNKEQFKMQFKMPSHYVAEWDCSHCGTVNKVTFDYRVERIPKKKIRKLKNG